MKGRQGDQSSALGLEGTGSIPERGHTLLFPGPRTVNLSTCRNFAVSEQLLWVRKPKTGRPELKPLPKYFGKPQSRKIMCFGLEILSSAKEPFYRGVGSSRFPLQIDPCGN